MIALRPFSIPKDGGWKHYPEGATVSQTVAKKFNLAQKGLVDSAPDGVSVAPDGAQQ